MVSPAKGRERWGVMCRGEVELLMQSFAFFVKPPIHEVGTNVGHMGVLSGGVEVAIKGRLL
jgi:hypothetical protein